MAVGEWDQRQLCSDGGCVGVIGPDGTCKVCGRAAQNWGDERKRGLIEPADEPADEDAAAADPEDGYEEEDGDEDDDLDEDEDLDEGEEEDDGKDDLDDDLDDEHDAPLAASASASLPATPVEWGSRRLCPDGSCIGLIGADGHCKVCGRAATGSPANGEPAAAAGFTIVTTEAAVETTDDVVQTTASTVKTGEPEASEPSALTPASDDPDSKEPGR